MLVELQQVKKKGKLIILNGYLAVLMTIIFTKKIPFYYFCKVNLFSYLLSCILMNNLNNTAVQEKVNYVYVKH